MAIPNSKSELITAIEENYAKLKQELLLVPGNLAARKMLEGHAKGSTMSVKDLVAYLNGWGQLVLSWNDKKSKGQAVDFPETGYKWNELGRLAQKFYKDHEADSYETLLVKLEATTNRILALIHSKTNKELYGVAWYEQWTLGRLIQLNTASPFKNAKDRIRKWKRTLQ